MTHCVPRLQGRRTPHSPCPAASKVPLWSPCPNTGLVSRVILWDSAAPKIYGFFCCYFLIPLSIMRLREPASIKALDLGKKKVHGDPCSILVFLHEVGRESGKVEK